MRRIAYLAAMAALATSCDALALGTVANVTIIDRDSGTALATHYYQGEYWVAGRPGGRYAIQVRDCVGGRVLAVTSVDGVNVISGETAGWDQSGYVLQPGESYQITGWRKSNAEVAAFTFTDSPNSYAQRSGRPANVGVIGVALFREREPQVAYATPYQAEPEGKPQPPRAEAGRAAANDSASAALGGTSGGMAADQRTLPARAAAPAPAPKLGTGHGERESSYVQDTEFARLQSEPNEVIRIRYDSLDNLVAMGIIRRPRPAMPALNPFPGSPERQFVPDPPG